MRNEVFHIRLVEGIEVADDQVRGEAEGSSVPSAAVRTDEQILRTDQAPGCVWVRQETAGEDHDAKGALHWPLGDAGCAEWILWPRTGGV